MAVAPQPSAIFEFGRFTVRRTPSRHIPFGAVREKRPRQRRADYEADAAALDRSSEVAAPVRRRRS